MCSAVRHRIPASPSVLLALALLLAPAVAAARPPGPPPGGPRGPSPERVIERYADRLGVTPDTTRAIREISEASRQRGRAIRERLEAAHAEMRRLLASPEPDRAAVMAQVEVIGGIELEEQRNRLMAMLEIHALLTPEQRMELVRIRDEKQGRRGRGRSEGPPLDACHRDAERLCAEARGRSLLQCLDLHWQELSDSCRLGFEHRPPPRRGGSHRGGGRGLRGEEGPGRGERPF